MKNKFFAAFLCTLFFLSIPAEAFANSGPTHWENPPSLSLTPLQNCPVTVEREDLSYDFTAKVQRDNSAGNRSYYSPAAVVTASYRMKNTSSKPVTVSMAFPLIASLSALSGMHEISITAGGRKIPFDIAIGGPMPDEGMSHNYYGTNGTLVKTSLPSFEKILQDVSQKPKALKILKGMGTRCDLRYPAESRIVRNENVWSRVCLTLGNGFAVTTGFNGSSERKSGMEVTADMSGTNTASLFSVGDGAKVLGVSAAAVPGNRENIQEIPDLKYSQFTADSYFDWLVGQSAVYDAYPSPKFRAALRTAAMEYADGLMTGNPEVAHEWLEPDGEAIVDDGLMGAFYEQNRILVLTYQVKFPANGTVPVSVSYPTGGEMEMGSKNSKNPVYTYGYLLNPAKGWAGFKDLNITIKPPAKCPCLVKSSLSFSKTKQGAYSAVLPSLPKNDLVFSLCANAKGGC